MFAVIIFLSLLASSWAEAPHHGVFVTCFDQHNCKLYGMAEAKRFLVESVLRGEYGTKLSIDFIPKANPVLVLYSSNGTELSREDVSSSMSFKALHTWVEAKGFVKLAVPVEPGADVGAPGYAFKEVEAALVAATAPDAASSDKPVKHMPVRKLPAKLSPGKMMRKRKHTRQLVPRAATTAVQEGMPVPEIAAPAPSMTEHVSGSSSQTGSSSVTVASPSAPNTGVSNTKT